jgi:hypothetical protein
MIRGYILFDIVKQNTKFEQGKFKFPGLNNIIFRSPPLYPIILH